MTISLALDNSVNNTNFKNPFFIYFKQHINDFKIGPDRTVRPVQPSTAGLSDPNHCQKSFGPSNRLKSVRTDQKSAKTG